MSASDRRRNRERKAALPKCHECGYHTARVCQRCGRPACKWHTFGTPGSHGGAPWTCVACSEGVSGAV